MMSAGEFKMRFDRHSEPKAKNPVEHMRSFAVAQDDNTRVQKSDFAMSQPCPKGNIDCVLAKRFTETSDVYLVSAKKTAAKKPKSKKKAKPKAKAKSKSKAKAKAKGKKKTKNAKGKGKTKPEIKGTPKQEKSNPFGRGTLE